MIIEYIPKLFSRLHPNDVLEKNQIKRNPKIIEDGLYRGINIITKCINKSCPNYGVDDYVDLDPNRMALAYGEQKYAPNQRIDLENDCEIILLFGSISCRTCKKMIYLVNRCQKVKYQA